MFPKPPITTHYGSHSASNLRSGTCQQLDQNCKYIFWKPRIISFSSLFIFYYLLRIVFLPHKRNWLTATKLFELIVSDNPFRKEHFLKMEQYRNNCTVFLTTKFELISTELISGREPSARWFCISQSTDKQTFLSSIFTPVNCWAWQNTLIT